MRVGLDIYGGNDMPYFRVTINQLLTDQEKYYIKFLPVNSNNVPTGEKAIHTHFEYAQLKKQHKQYNKKIIQEEIVLHPDEVDYTCSTLIFSRDTKINKIAKHPEKFLEKMEKKLQSVFVITNYTCDLQGQDAKLAASYYKTQGARAYQEDTILINELDAKFATLADNEIKHAITDAFKEAEDKIELSYCSFNPLRGGSTALVAVILNNTLYLANLGDSTGYLVTDNHVARLNTKLHDKRITHYDEILNINGAFGDLIFGDEIIHVPDIYTLNLTDLIHHETVELILASDGLTEKSKLKPTKDDVKLMQKMIGQHKHHNPKVLVKSALLEHDSTDNISVIQVDLKALLHNKRNAIFAVFDGHRDTLVSKELEKQFYSILRGHLNKALKNKKHSVTANTIFDKSKKLKDIEIIEEHTNQSFSLKKS